MTKSENAITIGFQIKILAGVQTLVWKNQDKSWTPSQNIRNLAILSQTASDRLLLEAQSLCFASGPKNHYDLAGGFLTSINLNFNQQYK
jgi:hypothetical protein